jgi:hypothetical protein
VDNADSASTIRVEIPQICRLAFEQHLAAMIGGYVASQQLDEGRLT